MMSDEWVNRKKPKRGPLSFKFPKDRETLISAIRFSKIPGEASATH